MKAIQTTNLKVIPQKKCLTGDYFQAYCELELHANQISFKAKIKPIKICSKLARGSES